MFFDGLSTRLIEPIRRISGQDAADWPLEEQRWHAPSGLTRMAIESVPSTRRSGARSDIRSGSAADWMISLT